MRNLSEMAGTSPAMTSLHRQNKLSWAVLCAAARRVEMLGGEPRLLHVEAEPGARLLETPADHPGIGAGPGHALAPLGVVILAAAHLPDQRKHVAIAIGKVRHQPFLEQVAHLERQPQQHVAGALDAGRLGGIENAFDLRIVDGGHDGRDHDRGWNAGSRELAQRFEPARRRRRARLHDARELGIERRHRDGDLGEIARGHAAEDIDVARDQVRLGDDPDRMAGAFQHFEDAAHDLVAPLDRLIRIRVGADRDRARAVARGRELALQQFRRVRLHEQLRFEIEPGREPEIGVRRPGKAVDAAVLAAAIRVDRAIEGNVRRVVAGDHLAGGIDANAGLERRQFLEALPAVVEGNARFRLVATGCIRLRAAPRPTVEPDLRVYGLARIGERGLGSARAAGYGRSGHGEEYKSVIRTKQEQNELLSQRLPLRSPGAPQHHASVLSVIIPDPE